MTDLVAETCSEPGMPSDYTGVDLFEPLLEALDAAGATDGSAYLSVPITSGRREFQLAAALGCPRAEVRRRFKERWVNEVVRPNEEEARVLARQARAAFPGEIVIDPSRVHIGQWSQDDFDRFWTTVISTFAQRVLVSPGWAFSRGARFEVAFAVARGLPLHDAWGASLDRADLEAQLEAAAVELRGLGYDDVEAELPAIFTAGASPAVVLPRDDPAAAASETFAWLVAERRYQTKKFGTELDDQHTADGLGLDGWWWQQLTNYYHRASVLGLETPVGRQAIAKFTATACGLLESVIRLHGHLPAPGVPSGEVVDSS
jgi:hypothetical protein